jgi:hypothetical protein
MRWILVAALCGAASSCNLGEQSCNERGTPECLDGDVCDLACSERVIETRECCECLEDFNCIDVDADRCVENLEAGGQIGVVGACVDDPVRCGAFCERFSVS